LAVWVREDLTGFKGVDSKRAGGATNGVEGGHFTEVHGCCFCCLFFRQVGAPDDTPLALVHDDTPLVGRAVDAPLVGRAVDALFILLPSNSREERFVVLGE
jgi:hypothetical protein